MWFLVIAENGINRVILATDGDFNVGTSETAAVTQINQGPAFLLGERRVSPHPLGRKAT
jgi:hypothetical protein